MIRSLRAKLILSHIVPTLLLLPLLSLYLLSTLEDFYTQSLLQQLVYQAQLLRNDIERDPELLTTPAAAQNFLATVTGLTDSRVILIDQAGMILASTRREDLARVGTRYDHPAINQALTGETAQGVGPGFAAEVAYVVIPIKRDGKIHGAMRLSYEVDDVRTQFNQLQGLVISGIALTVLLASIIALALATTIIRPLQQLALRAREIADGNYDTRVTTLRHDELGMLAQSFNEMATRLDEAQHARERQLAAIVHEIARPIAGMHAAVETLRDVGEADREMRDTLLIGIQGELARFERLIGTLQGLHRRALRPLQLARSTFALERVIRASVANFEPAAARAGIGLSIEIPDNLPRIHADEDRLIQVLTNLLDNALKFTLRGGKVVVRAGVDIGKVWVAVADTGVGIAPEELSNIFQQFYRGDESRPPEKRGMGLGLAICREIITAHQGDIHVVSELGRGSEFTFWLPFAG